MKFKKIALCFLLLLCVAFIKVQNVEAAKGDLIYIVKNASYNKKTQKATFKGHAFLHMVNSNAGSPTVRIYAVQKSKIIYGDDDNLTNVGSLYTNAFGQKNVKCCTSKPRDNFKPAGGNNSSNIDKGCVGKYAGCTNYNYNYNYVEFEININLADFDCDESITFYIAVKNSNYESEKWISVSSNKTQAIFIDNADVDSFEQLSPMNIFDFALSSTQKNFFSITSGIAAKVIVYNGRLNSRDYQYVEQGRYVGVYDNVDFYEADGYIRVPIKTSTLCAGGKCFTNKSDSNSTCTTNGNATSWWTYSFPRQSWREELIYESKGYGSLEDARKASNSCTSSLVAAFLQFFGSNSANLKIPCDDSESGGCDGKGSYSNISLKNNCERETFDACSSQSTTVYSIIDGVNYYFDINYSLYQSGVFYPYGETTKNFGMSPDSSYLPGSKIFFGAGNDIIRIKTLFWHKIDTVTCYKNGEYSDDCISIFNESYDGDSGFKNKVDNKIADQINKLINGSNNVSLALNFVNYFSHNINDTKKKSNTWTNDENTTIDKVKKMCSGVDLTGIPDETNVVCNNQVYEFTDSAINRATGEVRYASSDETWNFTDGWLDANKKRFIPLNYANDSFNYTVTLDDSKMNGFTISGDNKEKQCNFYVKNDSMPPPGGEEPNSNYLFRPISLTNPFPNRSVSLVWKLIYGDKLNERFSNTYNNLDYRIVLTNNEIREIRKHNEDPVRLGGENNSYINLSNSFAIDTSADAKEVKNPYSRYLNEVLCNYNDSWCKDRNSLPLLTNEKINMNVCDNSSDCDVNGDGKADGNDYYCLVYYIGDGTVNNGCNSDSFDVDGNGTVNQNDLISIFIYVNGVQSVQNKCGLKDDTTGRIICDVDNSGEIDSKDVVYMLKSSASIPGYNCTSGMVYCDANGDEKFNTADSTSVLQYLSINYSLFAQKLLYYIGCGPKNVYFSKDC